jgi:hypothetical protein
LNVLADNASPAHRLPVTFVPALLSATLTHSSSASVGVAPNDTPAVPAISTVPLFDPTSRSLKLFFCRVAVAVFVRDVLSGNDTFVYVQLIELPAARFVGNVTPGQLSVALIGPVITSARLLIVAVVVAAGPPLAGFETVTVPLTRMLSSAGVGV